MVFVVVLTSCVLKSQVVNYIGNGSFEEVETNTSIPSFRTVKFWAATDSLKFYGELLSSKILPIKVPSSSYTYQLPRTGNNHLIAQQFCTSCPIVKRGYPRNRLKHSLKANVEYCFSMYVNLSNESTHGIDALGVYFSDSTIDTIKKCNIPITYLTPQVENPINSLLTDTLNWVLIRGQFIANGIEKYALIGNFRSDTNTNTVLTNSTNLPANGSVYLLDDISLIELNLPAFAGRDTTFKPGDSLFLGRQPDVGIDEACVWYKLPNQTPIDTIAGFWIKPSETCTYVVKQEICGLVKWDTVVVKKWELDVALNELKIINDRLKIYPNPADGILNVVLRQAQDEILNDKTWFEMKIMNAFGQLVQEEEVTFTNNKATINTNHLNNGVYVLTLKSGNKQTVSKRFVVAR